MINIAEKYINDKKYAIKKSNTKIDDLYDKEIVDGYIIESNLLKMENYYQCYEFDVKISSKSNNLQIKTYVTKE
ncbi:MAG: hypothetical protein ACRDD7_08140 [Peptostreptococcaceae bacterium]